MLGDIIEDTNPQVIIEIGTFEGGAALWMADLVQSLGRDCPVISIDIRDCTGGAQHQGVKWVRGNAADQTTLDEVKKLIGNRRGMVIEDSDHKEHVTSKLLEMYAPLIAPGCYFIVEDTICEFTGLPPFPGPLGAVKAFVAQHPEFIIDRSREKYVMTYNPMGYLLRQK